MSDLNIAQTPTADHVRLALSLMADGAHIVLSGVPDDPSLASYSFPGHIAKALHAKLADAQAAQAMVVEQAALVAGRSLNVGEAAMRIRDLAHIDGLARVRELLAEIASSNKLLTDEARASLERLERAETAEAERDTLAAANAVLEAKVAGLRDFIDEFAKAKIDALRYSPPYGSSPEDDPDPVVDAETVWAWQADAKAALATQEAGT